MILITFTFVVNLLLALKKALDKIGMLFFLTMEAHSILAQDCDGYIASKQGTKMEVTSYNEKGKVQLISKNLITSREGSGNQVRWMIHCESTDEKHHPVANSDYEARCYQGSFFISLKKFITADQMKAWEKMDVRIDAEEMEIPLEPSPGQQLKDAQLSCEVSLQGIAMPGMKMLISDRKVESMEQITTPAGTFECIKISSRVNIMSLVKTELRMIEWYSKDCGLVRSENYQGEKNKGYSVLTFLEK